MRAACDRPRLVRKMRPSSPPTGRARAAITSAKQRWLVFGGFAFSAVLFFVVYQPRNLSRFMVGAPVGRDFVNFWTGGYLALQGRLDLLVDFAGYNDFIAATFHRDNPFDERVFSYPPHILLFLVPFATLPIVPAVFLWTALNVWLIGRSVRLLARDEPALCLAACLSPAVVTMVAFGHFGGALAFLATYVLTRTEARPHIAGICLALMSVKPQLALAFGIFLLFTGRWRGRASHGLFRLGWLRLAICLRDGGAAGDVSPGRRVPARHTVSARLRSCGARHAGGMNTRRGWLDHNGVRPRPKRRRKLGGLRNRALTLAR